MFPAAPLALHELRRNKTVGQSAFLIRCRIVYPCPNRSLSHLLLLCRRSPLRFEFGPLRTKVQCPPSFFSTTGAAAPRRNSPRASAPRRTSRASKTPLPDKQQNQKQLHPIGCTHWTPMLRFERPEKFLFSLRGTSFFCSPRFLSPISLKSSSKLASLRASFSCFCFSFPSFPGP